MGHGFLLDKGTFTTIDFPGAAGTTTFGINAAGQIVGIYGDAGGTEHGYLLDKGTFTTIDVPGSTLTQAFDINARGQIVGDYTDASGTSHGFLLDKGTFTTIDPPGSVFTQAIGINAAGRIVGDFELPGQHHGFLLDKGTFTLIDFPGPPTGTDALGINAADQSWAATLPAGRARLSPRQGHVHHDRPARLHIHRGYRDQCRGPDRGRLHGRQRHGPWLSSGAIVGAAHKLPGRGALDTATQIRG